MPIDDLFVNTDELDEELVSTVLRPYLRIDPKTLAIRPEATWRTASNKSRVIAYLLARKALRAKSLLQAADEAVAPGAIIEATGVPSGSVYPTLKELLEARPQVVDRENGSRYLIPGWAVATACEILQKEVSS